MKKLFKSLIIGTSILASHWSLAANSDYSALTDITDKGELKVCFDAGYMPFEMKSKKGGFMGFDIDIGKQMAAAMGVKYVPVNTAWDGIIPSLVTGKCHIIMAGMTITAQRNMKVSFADPYIVVGQSILVSPELAGSIKSYRDLNNPKYTVSTKLGTTGDAAVKRLLPKANTNLFETETDAVLEFVNGKADAFVYDMPFNAIYSAKHKDKIKHLDKPFTYEPLGWAIRQGDPDFLNFLNNYLSQIKGDGTYDRIYNKWFKNDAWLKRVQ
ncbi:transporter substrate-binding domain-containing protein [Oceanospirillum sediminis]|uniref:Transporter substrate-binding domain-containing protein n=1 Tax=Oceanospirillum sediminis TaxID=2760088 RepID=A0A839ISX8_9GAMM|nr:transporter substrate-binding domain-containing protein [Oceanospirillum sediminis]MBB1487579.1 transporter substrate-binding domain-containing protein [Oceanospirillum sediminis]